MPRKKMWVEYPDEGELSDDRDTLGAKSALVRDGDNKLLTHAKLYETDDADYDFDYGDESAGDAAAAVVGGLVLVGLAVGAGAAIQALRGRKERRRALEGRSAESRADDSQDSVARPRVAAPAGWYDDGFGRLRWWDGQLWTEHFHVGNPRVGAPAGWYDVGSGHRRWWDGQEWTAHFQASQIQVPRESTSRAEAPTAPSSDMAVAFETPIIGMSRAEWQERVRAMLIARSISEVQWRLLANARIEDADSELLNWQDELRKITPQQFSDHMNYVLATDRAAHRDALKAATAGWYDDGSGRKRWWDGQAWTQYFQTAPITIPAKPQAATPDTRWLVR